MRFQMLDAVDRGNGIYEFADLIVGRSLSIMAAPTGTSDSTYGYQFARGSASISFAGQIAATTIRLPGQGSIHAFWVIVGVMVIVLGGSIGYFRHRDWL